MIKALKDIFSFIVGLIVLGFVITIGILIFQTGPYSFYFVGIALIYLLINFIFKNKIKKLVEGKAENENKIKLQAIYFIRNIFRLFLFALIPIVIIQIVLDKASFLGIGQYVEKIEYWYIKIAQFSDMYHLREIFIILMIFVLLIAPILFSQTKRGKYAFSSLTKALFILNIIFFILSFSFYTTIVSEIKEEKWKFDKRVEIKIAEMVLRKEVNDYYILSQIGLSPSIQNNIIKLITAIISVGVVDEVREKVYQELWTNKVSIEDEIKLELLKVLDTELEIYKTQSIDELFKENYNPNYVLKRLKALKQEENKFSNLKRAKLETLSNSISLSLSNILPDIDNSIIKQIVDESLDKAMDFKIKFFFRDEKLKIPALILATRLNVLEPNAFVLNNEEFIARFESSLDKMKDTDDIEYISEKVEENYFEKKLSHENSYKYNPKSSYEYHPKSSWFEHIKIRR